MKITEDVILDLLPLYFEDEVSNDTKSLIDAYFVAHPAFARSVKEQAETNKSMEIPIPLNPEDEMKTLNKTQKLFKFRTLLMAVAIFTTALPFSIWDVSFDNVDGANSLWNAAPEAAILSGIIAIISWAGYLMINRRLSATGI